LVELAFLLGLGTIDDRTIRKMSSKELELSYRLDLEIGRHL
jgi:hypothetical protein